jgi:hypothetical protein
LDVEEKARAKDVRGKKTIEGGSSAHVVQKNPQHSHKKNSSKNSNEKILHLLRRRNKEKRNCFTCDKPGYYAKDCPDDK